MNWHSCGSHALLKLIDWTRYYSQSNVHCMSSHIIVSSVTKCAMHDHRSSTNGHPQVVKGRHSKTPNQSHFLPNQQTIKIKNPDRTQLLLRRMFILGLLITHGFNDGLRTNKRLRFLSEVPRSNYLNLCKLRRTTDF